MKSQGNLFLFQWDAKAAKERVRELRKAGWKVGLESEDGARGGKLVVGNPPDVVVLDLARRPSHSRETAHALRAYKATRSVPIVFVDGDEVNIEKTKAKVPDGLFTSSAKLKSVLKTFSS